MNQPEFLDTHSVAYNIDPGIRLAQEACEKDSTLALGEPQLQWNKLGEAFKALRYTAIAGVLSLASIGDMAPSQAQASNEAPPPPAGSIIDFTTAKPNSVAVVNLTSTEADTGWLQLLGPNDVPGAYSSLNDYHTSETFASLGVVMTDSKGKARIKSQSAGHKIVDVEGYFAPGVFTVDNRRVLDTRVDHPEALPAGTFLTVKGTPNSTQLVNLTADGVVQSGYVEVLQAGEQPGGHSNLNASVGQIVNRPSLMQYDANGDALVYVQGSMQLIVDSIGTFASNTINFSGTGRLLDTRGGVMPAAGSMNKIHGKPNSTGIVSVIAMNGMSSGYIQTVGKGDTPAATSTANIEKLSTRPADPIGNLSFVNFDANGEASVFTLQAGDLVADVLGYISDGSFIVTPGVRVLDTRIPDLTSFVQEYNTYGQEAISRDQLSVTCTTNTTNVYPGDSIAYPTEDIAIKVTGLPAGVYVNPTLLPTEERFRFRRVEQVLAGGSYLQDADNNGNMNITLRDYYQTTTNPTMLHTYDATLTVTTVNHKTNAIGTTQFAINGMPC